MPTTARRTLVAAGVVFILATGLIHLSGVGSYLDEAPYMGYLFIANVAGAAVTAIGLLTVRYRRAAWMLGLVVAGGALIAFLASRFVAFPQMSDDVGNWEGTGVLALIVEGLYVLVAISALSAGRAVAGRARPSGRPVAPRA